MLLKLKIKNFALIEELEINFNSCLNILTGETGAGKSLIGEALNFILGKSFNAEIIKAGKSSAHVQAIFDIKYNFQFKNFLKNKMKKNFDNLILSRELNNSGKNICRLNEDFITLTMLKETGDYLIDLHYQHEHHQLMKSTMQLKYLDYLGEAVLTKKLKILQDNLNQYKELNKKIQIAKNLKEENFRKIEWLKFEIKEIENFNLTSGEEENLKEEKNLLNNYEKITRLINELRVFQDGGISLRENLANFISKLEKLSDLESKFKERLTQLKLFQEEIEDIFYLLGDYHENINYSPQNLEEINKRLFLISEFKKKYGQNLEEIKNYYEKIKKELSQIEIKDEDFEKWHKDLKILSKNIIEESGVISKERIKLAKLLEDNVKEGLISLKMPQVRFEVKISSITEGEEFIWEDKIFKIKEEGAEEVEFLVSFNPDEPLKNLKKVASGGELSRLMLIFKIIFAKFDQVNTLFFDEIDQGLGGAAAEIAAMRLKELSGNFQIICITHLASIAARANKHFRINKRLINSKTKIILEEL
ncbi:MAG: DNA repair protein RecN, partial [Armatimonadetes bacterium]|nr:DNA repair protein RecN [Armatimonadota bacterium]